ncbi:mitochondrial chaperone [Cordyceps militaris]|uniref:Mitochondrial chaperone n=1 Tax=Cordyceps militaris TaxID=73501 RepID=A0A2H4S7H3_CORMI|nr:mitochondrial chaperone [Cordyceps militaris]
MNATFSASNSCAWPPATPKPLRITNLPIPGVLNSAMPQLLAWGMNSYGPLMLVFGFIAILKSYAYQAQAWFIAYFTTTTSVESTDEMYDMLMAWVSSHGLNEAARSRLARVGVTWANQKNDSSGLVKKPISLSPWKGSFHFRFKSHLLYYQTETVVTAFSRKETVSITCIGRSGDALNELLDQCRLEYLQKNEGNITIFENHGNFWKRRATKEIRPLSTVMLPEHRKEALVNDVREFVDPATREWYRQKKFAYRRGYLFHGPPGTGKSSLSSAIAGEFGMDIYIVNIPGVDDQTLTQLFNELPDRCVVLLEDIDAVGIKRSASEWEQKERKQSLSLSGLLNELDGVASREGRLLIMTTNYKNLLDDALIREGRVDLNVEFGLADSVTAANLFNFMYEPIDGAKPLTKVQAHVLARCATEFAALIPEFEFSGAQITSYLLQYRGSPASALDNASKWVTRILRERADKYKKAASGASLGPEPVVCPEVPAESDLLPSRWQANPPSTLLQLSDASLGAAPSSTGSTNCHSAVGGTTSFRYTLPTTPESQVGKYEQDDSRTDISEGSCDGLVIKSQGRSSAIGISNPTSAPRSSKQRFLRWKR